MKKKIFLYVSEEIGSFLKVQQAFYALQFPVQWVHLVTGAQVVAYLENLKIGEPLPQLIMLDHGLSSTRVKQEFLNIQRHNPYKRIPFVIYSSSMDVRTQAFFKNWNVKVWVKRNPVDIKALLPTVAENEGT